VPFGVFIAQDLHISVRFLQDFTQLLHPVKDADTGYGTAEGGTRVALKKPYIFQRVVHLSPVLSFGTNIALILINTRLILFPEDKNLGRSMPGGRSPRKALCGKRGWP
jgi:hypothetical protein